MSSLSVSSSALDALIKPSQLPGSFSLNPSGLYPSSENPHRTTFPNQFSSTSFLHCTSPPNSNPPSKEVLLRSLQDILHQLHFEDKAPTSSTPLVPCTTKYANASSLPISGYLAVVHLDTTTPGQLPTSSLQGPFLVVLGPTAFSFNSTPISSDVFGNAPTTYSQGQFPFPTSTLAPAFAFLSGHPSSTLPNLNSLEWIQGNPSSLMVSLRAQCALFFTVISHSMDNPLPIDQGWASLQIPTVPSTTTDSTPPSGHTDFNTALAARVEALNAKLNEANESVLTLSPPLVDNSSAPATSSTWLLLAAHPLPEHHSLPIGLFIDPSKVPTPDDLISVVISWFNQLGHPPTRLVSEDHLRTSLARLSNPYTGAWLSAIAANADQFACTWHSDSGITPSFILPRPAVFPHLYLPPFIQPMRYSRIPSLPSRQPSSSINSSGPIFP